MIVSEAHKVLWSWQLGVHTHLIWQDILLSLCHCRARAADTLTWPGLAQYGW